MSGAFVYRNCCAVFFAAAVVALMIAASVAPWYNLQDNFSIALSSGSSTSTSTTTTVTTLSTTTYQINSTKIYYDLNGIKTTFALAGTVSSSSYVNLSQGTSIRDVTKTSQAFVLIALLSGFILLVILLLFFLDRIRNKLIFAIGMTLTRFIAAAFAAVALLAVLIAFLVYLGVVHAFKSDSPNCVDGPCRKFVDSSSKATVGSVMISGMTGMQSGTITENLIWGPLEGWYITVVTTLPAVLLVLLVVINKFPLPIDSEASSGEAL